MGRRMRIRRLCAVLLLLLSWAGRAHAQSWTSPRTWTDTELVTETIMNAHVRDNLIVLRAGGVAIASQAANEIIYATSATQLGRSANLTFGSSSFIVKADEATAVTLGLYADEGDETADRWSLSVSTAGVLSVSRSDVGATFLSFAADGITSGVQPGFLAYNSADDTLVSNGSTVDLDSEVYDEGSDFASDTFTAPVTGRYLLCASISIITAGAADTRGINIVTSNRTYYITQLVVATATDDTAHSGCVVADMDAADTATVQVLTGSTTVTVDGESPQLNTHFSGRLLP